MNTDIIVDNVEKFFGADKKKILGIFFVRKMDTDGKISFLYLSDGAKDILGVTENIGFDDYLNMIHFADKDNYIKAIDESAKNLSDYVENYRIINADGKMHWLKGSLNVKRLDDGSVIWNGILVDISELKQKEEWLATTLNNAPEGIITFSECGFILSINDTMCSLFGYGENDLIGKHVSMLMTDEHAGLFSDYIEKYLAIVKSDGTQKLKNYECLKKDGTVFPVEFSLNDVKNEGRLLFILAIRDISERKRIENELKENQIKLENIVSAMPCVFFTSVINADGTQERLYITNGANRVFGLGKDKNEVKNDELMQWLEDEDKNEIVAFRKGLFQSDDKDMDYFERELRLKNGRWLQMSIKPEKLKDGKILNHGLFVDITKRKHAEEKIRFMAYNDTMTGTGNRAFLMKEFPKFIASAERNNNRFAVISIVPANMSTFYANSGYDIGDKLMADVANRVKEFISSRDCLTYVSGSRFVLLKGGINNLKELDDVCLNITNAFKTPLVADRQEFDVNIKIGVSIYPDHNTDPQTLLKYSEAALTNAKLDYNGEYLMFTEEMKANLARKLSLRSRLKYAIQNDEVVPFFQAQVDVKTGNIMGMEVLARWIDKKEGVISPIVFIPIAEEYGLIEEMTEKVIEQACRINKRWIDENIARVPIAVNVSGKHPPASLLKLIEKMLDEVKIPPDCLEVELTESSMMDDPVISKRTMLKLLDMGVTCSIDDFGTGYSSLSMLKTFPIKKIKIDRSFVLDIDKDNGYAIVNATIAMGKALNLTILAEGVDNKNHFKILKKQGCEIIQGYLFSKPMNAFETEQKLKSWNPEKEISLVNE